MYCSQYSQRGSILDIQVFVLFDLNLNHMFDRHLALQYVTDPSTFAILITIELI